MNNTKKINLNPSQDTAVDFGHSVIFLRPDGIVEINCANDFEYDVDAIKQNLEHIKKLANGKRLLVLNNSKEYTTVSKEARDYIGSGTHKDFIKAEAFVIHTLGQLLLGNLFMRVNKPIVPARLFKNKESAEAWLKSFE